MRMLLASASPRRAELLAAAGYVFEVKSCTVDETPLPGEIPALYVARLAAAKAGDDVGVPTGRAQGQIARSGQVWRRGASWLGNAHHAARRGKPHRVMS